MLTPPTVQELATFTGRANADYTEFALEALNQASLLFSLATGLESYPGNEDLARLAKNGILDMADSIYLSQPYRESSASPFQSETIGSYSYTKAMKAVSKGDATGIMWFDLAVNKLKTTSASIVASGSIEGMENEGIAVDPATGKSKIIGATGNSRGRISWGPEEESIFLYPYN